MTIERPTFPPTGSSSGNVFSFPKVILGRPQPREEAPATEKDWRSQEHVREDIAMHVEARSHYAQAVAWEAAAESQNLPPSQVEEARKRTAEAFEKMQYRARNLLVVMPSHPRALVDLLLYLEQNFSVLPQEFDGQSLAFNLLRTVRLSLRKIAQYGVGR